MRTTSRWFAFGTFALALVSISTGALAQGAPSAAKVQLEGRKHLRVARWRHATGDYQGALEELARAWIAAPSPELLVDMAAAHARLDAPGKAATLLARYLVESKGTVSEERKARVLEAIAQLRVEAESDEAEKLVERARQLRDASRFERALSLYGKALALEERPAIWMERADTAVRAGKHALALEAYTRYRGNGAGFSTREGIQKIIEELYSKVARIEIECPIKGATVRIDERVRAKTPLAEPIFVEPGSHSVVVEKDGRVLMNTTVEAVAGRPVSLSISTDVKRPD